MRYSFILKVNLARLSCNGSLFYLSAQQSPVGHIWITTSALLCLVFIVMVPLVVILTCKLRPDSSSLNLNDMNGQRSVNTADRSSNTRTISRCLSSQSDDVVEYCEMNVVYSEPSSVTCQAQGRDIGNITYLKLNN